MAATLYALPIPSERADAVRSFAAVLLGPRRAAFERSWREKRITRETAWLQPMGDHSLVLVYLEAEDIARAFQQLATSQTPFDRWYRQQVLEIYGVDLTEAGSGPLSQLVADWAAP
jgi:hypothetical protein